MERDLKERLYQALYWHFRKEYAKAIDLFIFENKINESSNYTTKNAETYVQKNIEKIISYLEESA